MCPRRAPRLRASLAFSVLYGCCMFSFFSTGPFAQKSNGPFLLVSNHPLGSAPIRLWSFSNVTQLPLILSLGKLVTGTGDLRYHLYEPLLLVASTTCSLEWLHMVYTLPSAFQMTSELGENPKPGRNAVRLGLVLLAIGTGTWVDREDALCCSFQSTGKSTQ